MAEIIRRLPGVTGGDSHDHAGGDGALVPLAGMADMATASLLGRKTALAGVPEVLSKSDVLTLLNVADGANAYAHPNHSGEVTSAGDGAQTIAAGAVSLSKMAALAANSIIGNNTGAPATPLALTTAQVLTALGNVNIGTTAVPLDRASAALTLGGITLTAPTVTNTLTFAAGDNRYIAVADAATDVAGSYLFCSGGSTVAGTAVDNVIGGLLLLRAGLGTGAGASNVAIQTGGVLASGTTLQTMTTRILIDNKGFVRLAASGPTVALLDMTTSLGGAYTLGSAPYDTFHPSGMIQRIYASGTANGTALTVYDVQTSTGTAQQAFVGALSENTAGNAPAAIVFGHRTGTTAWTERLRLNSPGNLLLGTITDGMTAAGSLAIAQDLAHRGTKAGFYNIAPVTRPTAYTQTYATASKTHANATAATLTDNTGGTADTTLAAIEATYTQATIRNNFADLVAMVNKLTADQLNIKQVLNAVIDDGQAEGLLQ